MKHLIALLALLCLPACSNNPSPNPPDPPKPEPTTVEITVVTCEGPADYCLKRPLVGGASVLVDGTATATTNANGYAKFRTKAGSQTLEARADGYEPLQKAITAKAGFNQDLVLKRSVPPLAKVTTSGRFFLVNGQTYRGKWTSGLGLLSLASAQRIAFLDSMQALGFDGVRVMAGDIGWANGQTPASGLANLPGLLQETAARGLYLYLVALTGTASGYNAEQYLTDISALCAPQIHCVLEVANEIGHGSQSSQVNDIPTLQAMALRVIPGGTTWALGAMLGQDEPINGVYPPTPKSGGALFSTAHLDRGRTPWPEMIRRVREIESISSETGKPAISGEPIGADEVEKPGSRSNLPELFYTYGALCRVFELGACVFHSEDGRYARLLGPIQTDCAKAFLDGFASIHSQTSARLAFKNAGWSGSDVPVASFSGATRVYSGVTGNEGYTVVVGDTGVQVEWKNGYHVVAELGRRPGVVVWKIAK